MSVSVFVCYAHEDRPLRDALAARLGSLLRQGWITDWYDSDVVPITEWERQISDHLLKANIIILLISADFLASDICYRIMQQAIAQHYKELAYVIPVIVRPVDYEEAPIEKLRVWPSNAKPVKKWENPDDAWANIAQEIRRVIVDFGLSKASSTVTVSQEQVWNIPYPRNPFFTGREKQLTCLHEALVSDSQTAALTQPRTISELGGIGKTQIALEYAYRHRDKYQYMLWTPSDTPEELISSFSAIAEQLNLPEKDEKDQWVTIKAVKRWLEGQHDWLLILDNADDPALVRKFIPEGYKGHVLLTTRESRVWRPVAQGIEVDTMKSEECMLLLLRRAALIEPIAGLEEATREERRIARKIVQEVDRQPLALDQAGAYIKETGCSLTDYLRLYQRRKSDLLRVHSKKSGEHSEALQAAWLRAFEKVEHANVAAADLLRLCAFLHPDTIPEEMIIEGAAHLGPALKSTATDTLAWNRTCEELCAYSLLKRDKKSKNLIIHRLNQKTVRDEMTGEEKQKWIKRAIKVLNEACPYKNVDVTHWKQYERIVPHALECAELSARWSSILAEMIPLLTDIADYLKNRGRDMEAESLVKLTENMLNRA